MQCDDTQNPNICNVSRRQRLHKTWQCERTVSEQAKMNKSRYAISIYHRLGKTLREHLLEPLDGNLPADQWHEWV